MKCAFGENPKGCYGQGLKKSPMTRMAVAALLQALQKALFPDICAGIVNKHAGLHVARRIDVAVDAAAGYAAAGKLAVVLEVDAVELLAAGDAANFTDAVLHIGALLRRQQQVGGGIDAHGHIVEVPCEHAALADQQVEEFVAGDHLIVLAGVADGHTEGDAVAGYEVAVYAMQYPETVDSPYKKYFASEVKFAGGLGEKVNGLKRTLGMGDITESFTNLLDFLYNLFCFRCSLV